MEAKEIHVGKLIKDACKQSNYKMVEIAKECGISKQTLNGWFNKDDLYVKDIKVSDVNLKDHYIFIRSEISKTHYSRISTMNPELEALVAVWISGAKQDDYLIGRNYKACALPQSNSRFVKDWEKMRVKLQLPEEMQLYSLRDTSITEMLKSGMDWLTVMQHADHHDLSMTTRYANHVDPHLVETISKKAPNF